MSEKMTDPRPAATEAAMMSNKELLNTYCGELLLAYDQPNRDQTNRRVLRRELESRLAVAAPPSGQVVVDAELVRQASTAARLVANWGDDKHPLDRSYWNGLADRLSALTGADR